MDKAHLKTAKNLNDEITFHNKELSFKNVSNDLTND